MQLKEIMIAKIQEYMVFQEVFLFNGIHDGQWFQLLEVRPALVIYALSNKITTLGQQRAHGDVHEILLLLLREFIPDIAKLLDTD